MHFLDLILKFVCILDKFLEITHCHVGLMLFFSFIRDHFELIFFLFLVVSNKFLISYVSLIVHFWKLIIFIKDHFVVEVDFWLLLMIFDGKSDFTL